MSKNINETVIPIYSVNGDFVNELVIKEKLKLTEEQGESNGWKVFFAIASFMLVPLL